MKLVESVFTGKRNGPLIAEVARLWIGPDDVVLDPTFGRGKFWTEFTPGTLITHDITIDQVDFRQLPEADASVDVVMFDPPYIAQGGRKTSGVQDFLDRYGLVDVPKTPRENRDLIAAGMKEAARVLRPGGRLMVKIMDYVSGGRLQLGRHHVVQTAIDLGLEQVDEFIHHSGLGPQPTLTRSGAPRQQVHSRRSHTFLCVFQLPPVIRKSATPKRRSV